MKGMAFSSEMKNSIKWKILMEIADSDLSKLIKKLDY